LLAAITTRLTNRKHNNPDIAPTEESKPLRKALLWALLIIYTAHICSYGESPLFTLMMLFHPLLLPPQLSIIASLLLRFRYHRPLTAKAFILLILLPVFILYSIVGHTKTIFGWPGQTAAIIAAILLVYLIKPKKDDKPENILMIRMIKLSLLGILVCALFITLCL
jgi:hypothetical protein